MKLTPYDRRASEYDPEYLLTMARAYTMLHMVRQALNDARGKSGGKRRKAYAKAWKLAQIAARGQALTIARAPCNDYDILAYHVLISDAAKLLAERPGKPLPIHDDDILF